MAPRKQALLGHSGFVGSNLARDTDFDCLVNSRNLALVNGQRFDRVVCAALPAAKWIANANPEADRANMLGLMAGIDRLETDLFVLISTVDVYPVPRNVDESVSPAVADIAQAYGRHRLEFEEFIRKRFRCSIIVRLPALFGPGLKKNAIFDLMHDNQLELINSCSAFQWYPVRRLFGDLDMIEKAGLSLVNIATEPLAMLDIQQRFFPGKVIGNGTGNAASYDFRTLHAARWGRTDGYCLGRDEVIEEIGGFVAGAGA